MFKLQRGTHADWRAVSVLALVVAAAASSLLLAGPAGATGHSRAAVCAATATGHAWKYKGQHGTQYSVIAVNAPNSLCAKAAKWMLRLSSNKATFQLKVVPAGWHCAAIGDYSGLAKLGQCTVGKTIVEWLPKQKK